MNIRLIENCYNNIFGFDLKRLHRKNSIPSEFHMIEGRYLTLDDLDKDHISFEDGVSNFFELIHYNGKNYLLGENSCYPCSIVYMNTSGYKWVDVFIVPDGKVYRIDNRFSQVKFNFLSLTELFSNIKEKELLLIFMDHYIKSFGLNNWFSKTHLIVMIRRSGLIYDEIVMTLYENKLLNPFQLSVTSILKGFKIKNNDLYYSLLVNNDVYLGIDYVISPSTRISFSNSTQKLLNNDVFKNYVLSLSQDEIDSFFEINFLIENIDFENSERDLIYDILNIEDIRRWEKIKVIEPIHRYKPDKLKKLKITFDLIKEYYNRLMVNLRSVENSVRKDKGINLVGSLFNETLLFRKLTDVLPKLSIISQYSPKWLGRQRFDIFIKELNVAIEYNGKQHYEPVEFYGGEQGFENTLKRDFEKREKCRLNNCVLIEIKYDENIDVAIDRIKNKISFLLDQK